MLFEARITFSPENSDQKAILELLARESHWKTSEIFGDPVLGKKNFFYFTTHGKSLMNIMHRIEAANQKARLRGIDSVRSTIEVVIYDTKEVA